MAVAELQAPSSPVQAHVPNGLCKAGRKKVGGMLQVCFCQRLDQHGAVLYLPLLLERLQLLASLGLQESRWDSSTAAHDECRGKCMWIPGLIAMHLADEGLELGWLWQVKRESIHVHVFHWVPHFLVFLDRRLQPAADVVDICDRWRRHTVGRQSALARQESAPACTGPPAGLVIGSLTVSSRLSSGDWPLLAASTSERCPAPLPLWAHWPLTAA